MVGESFLVEYVSKLDLHTALKVYTAVYSISPHAWQERLTPQNPTLYIKTLSLRRGS